MVSNLCIYCEGRASLFCITNDFKVEICTREVARLRAECGEQAEILPLKFYDGINSLADAQLFKEVQSVLNSNVQRKYQEIRNLMKWDTKTSFTDRNKQCYLQHYSAPRYVKHLVRKKNSDLKSIYEESKEAAHSLQFWYETVISYVPDIHRCYEVYKEIKSQREGFQLLYQYYSKTQPQVGLFLSILNTCTNKENRIQAIARDLSRMCQLVKKLVDMKEKKTDYELLGFEAEWTHLCATIQREVMEEGLKAQLLQILETTHTELQERVKDAKRKALDNIAQVNRDTDSLTAQKCFEDALHTFQLFGDDTELVDALSYIAEHCMRSGRAEESRSAYERVIQVCKEHHIINEQFAIACNQTANMKYRKKQHRTALIYYKDALAAYESIDVKGEGRGNTMENIGILHTELGEWTEAERVYTDTLKFRRSIGDQKWVQTCLRLGSLHQVQGNYKAAERDYDLAKKWISTNSPLAVTLYNSLGMLYDQLGKDTEAEDAYHTAFRLFDIHDVSKQTRATVCYNYAKLCFTLKKFDEAKRYFELSVSLQTDETSSGKERSAEALQSLADTCVALKDIQAALTYYNTARTVLETLSSPPYSLIEVYESLGQLTGDEDYYEKAFQALPRIMKQEKLIPSCKFLGDHFITHNDRSKARICYETAIIGQSNSAAVEVLIELCCMDISVGDFGSAKTYGINAFPWIRDRYQASDMAAVLGSLSLYAKCFNDAESWYSQAILLLPDSAETELLRLYIGDQFLKLGLYEGAVQAFLPVFNESEGTVNMCFQIYLILLEASVSRAELVGFFHAVTKRFVKQENKTAVMQQCLKEEKDRDSTFHICIELIIREMKEAMMFEAQVTILEMLKLGTKPITAPASEEVENIHTCFTLALEREELIGFNSVFSLFLLLCKKCPTAIIHSTPYQNFMTKLDSKKSERVYKMIRKEMLDLKREGVSFKGNPDLEDAAVLLFELAVELLKMLPPDKSIALAVNEIGDLLNEMNKYQKGKEMYDESISILEKSSYSFQ